jgi:hypothetical protein
MSMAHLIGERGSTTSRICIKCYTSSVNKKSLRVHLPLHFCSRECAPPPPCDDACDGSGGGGSGSSPVMSIHKALQTCILSVSMKRGAARAIIWAAAGDDTCQHRDH